MSILQANRFKHPSLPVEPAVAPTTCTVPLVAGPCGEPVPDGLTIPLCFSHVATAWEWCQGRIMRARVDNREAEAAERSATFVSEFATAREEMAAVRAALEADPEIDDPSSVVYYLRFADRIKIGFSRNLGTRLLVIPHDELLAVEPGGPLVERRRHRQFADHRIIGEWFQACEPVLDHVQQVKAAEAERDKGQRRMMEAFDLIERKLPCRAKDAQRLGLADPVPCVCQDCTRSG